MWLGIHTMLIDEKLRSFFFWCIIIESERERECGGRKGRGSRVLLFVCYTKWKEGFGLKFWAYVLGSNF